MYANYSPIKHQQNKISNYHHKLNALSFFNHLTSDQLFERVDSLLPEHRERTFPPTKDEINGTEGFNFDQFNLQYKINRV